MKRNRKTTDKPIDDRGQVTVPAAVARMIKLALAAAETNK